MKQAPQSPLPPAGGARGGPARSPLESRLTERQAQVLIAMAEGKTTKGTALDLNLSHRTVEIHRGTATRAIGAKNTFHAAILLDRERQAAVMEQAALIESEQSCPA